MLWREHEKSELGTDFVRSMLPSSGLHDGLLAYESFDYPEGPLAAQNGGFGWAGTWFDIADDIEAGPSSNRVMSGSLAIEGIMPQGNRAAQTSQKNRIRRSLSTSVGGVFDVAGLVENQDGLRLVGRDGQEVYISFIQKVSALGDNFYGVELCRGDGNLNRVLCVGHGVEGTGYGITSNSNVYGLPQFTVAGEYFLLIVSSAMQKNRTTFCLSCLLETRQLQSRVESFFWRGDADRVGIRSG